MNDLLKLIGDGWSVRAPFRFGSLRTSSSAAESARLNRLGNKLTA